MRKAKCPVCRQIQMTYNRDENNFVCTCGHIMDHHPDLCPIYHREWGCAYSKMDPPHEGDQEESNARG